MELYRAGGVHAAWALSGLVAAAAKHGAPLAWRGGRMAAVPKKATAAVTLQNSRGVLCSDTAGKLYGKVMRTQAAAVLEVVAADWQMGAVSGKGTEFPGFAIRTFLEDCKKQRRKASAFTIRRPQSH